MPDDQPTANEPQPYVHKQTLFDNQRDAAAWMINQGRKLIASNVPISRHISRSDNNATFEVGWQLISIGRRIATGYKFGSALPEATYKAHIRATRRNKGSKP